MTTACCTLGAQTPFSSHLPLPGVPEAAPALSLLLHSILAAYTTAVEPVVATPLGLHVHHSLPGVLRAESRVGSFHTELRLSDTRCGRFAVTAYRHSPAGLPGM